MKGEIRIKKHLIYIESEKEFAIMQRFMNVDGLQEVTFSVALTAKDADMLNASGIVEVQSFSENGKLIFSRENFYETHLMAEIVMDVLKRHENK